MVRADLDPMVGPADSGVRGKVLLDGHGQVKVGILGQIGESEATAPQGPFNPIFQQPVATRKRHRIGRMRRGLGLRRINQDFAYPQA